MAAADFWLFIPAPHDAGSPEANHQISPGITHSPSRLSLSDIRRIVRASIGLCIHWPAHPTASPLSAGCSSEQRFASSFLPIPPRDGHPCCSANTSPCRVCRGLTPPSECALPGAPRKGLRSDCSAGPSVFGRIMAAPTTRFIGTSGCTYVEIEGHIVDARPADGPQRDGHGLLDCGGFGIECKRDAAADQA